MAKKIFNVYKNRFMVRCVTDEDEVKLSDQINRRKDPLVFIGRATEEEVLHPRGVLFATGQSE